MKTFKHTLNRLMSIMLVVLLLMSIFGSTVYAADNLHVLIKNAPGLPKMVDEQFTTYQIFSGTPKKETFDGKENPNSTPNDWNAQNWNNYSLADIGWGKDIKGSELVNALKALTFDLNAEAFPEFFDGDQNNFFASLPAGADAGAAVALAELLTGKSNAFLQEFSKFIVKGTGESYLQQGDGFGTKSTAKEDGSESYLNVPETGYYLIVENGDHRGDAVSEYILAVLGDQEITLKASVPMVDKTITDGDNDSSKGDVEGVGDTVAFNLKGNLPKNFTDFTTFFYSFVDNLSKGLTFDPASVKVTVVQDGHTYTIDPKEYKVVIEPTFEANGGNVDRTITVTFDDLRKADGLAYTDVTPRDLEATSGQLVLTASAGIHVSYTATVNTDAVIGSAGNPNDVLLQYSNDPNSDSKGETEKTEVYVFAFGFDFTKLASDLIGPDGDASKAGLAGASFTLKNANGKYAEFETKDGKRVLKGWVQNNQTVEDLIQAYKDAKKAYDNAGEADKVTKKQQLDTVFENLAPYVLTSDASGALPDVSAFDEGTYTLEEVVTPDGYNTMKPFEFTIEAQINVSTGKLEKFTYTHDGNTKTYLPSADQYTNDVLPDGTPNREQVVQDGMARFETGLAADSLVNRRAPFLPFTGGMGRMLFYLLGGVLIAGAVVYLVLVVRKRNKAKNNS